MQSQKYSQKERNLKKKYQKYFTTLRNNIYAWEWSKDKKKKMTTTRINKNVLKKKTIRTTNTTINLKNISPWSQKILWQTYRMALGRKKTKEPKWKKNKLRKWMKRMPSIKPDASEATKKPQHQPQVNECNAPPASERLAFILVLAHKHTDIGRFYGIIDRKWCNKVTVRTSVSKSSWS